MSAGTVLSGGFPGRVAQEVTPNPKCHGCLHYDGQAGRIGACTIGERPWNCGDGDMADIGYAPLARGGGAYLPDMSNHDAQAPEVETQFVSDLYGSGSTRPVPFNQVSLGEEHVHLVKSMLEQHSRLQKSMCRLCSNRNAIGTAPFNIDPQVCTCEPIAARDIAKSIARRLSNAERQGIDLNGITEWVREVAKGGFKTPKVKAKTKNEKPLENQVSVTDHAGGHLQKLAVEKGLSWKPGASRGGLVAKQHLGSYHVTPSGPHADGFSAHYLPREGQAQHLGEHSSKKKAQAAAEQHFTSKSLEHHVGEDVSKAIDNAKHSHIVTGKLAASGRGAVSRRSASRMVDKLDHQYGGYGHSVSRNPSFKPKTLKFESNLAHTPGATVAEAGHGTYLHEPAAKHAVTYHPHEGMSGPVHVGYHSSPSEAHVAAQAHHDKTVGE